MKNTDDFKKNIWYHIITIHDGNDDMSKVKMYYNEKIDGIDYQVCRQNGKIISKINLKDIIY